MFYHHRIKVNATQVKGKMYRYIQNDGLHYYVINMLLLADGRYMTYDIQYGVNHSDIFDAVRCSI
jgi:hypothetical protein